MITCEQTPALAPHMLLSIAIPPHSPLRPVRSMTKHRSRSPVGPGLTEGTIEDFLVFWYWQFTSDPARSTILPTRNKSVCVLFGACPPHVTTPAAAARNFNRRGARLSSSVRGHQPGSVRRTSPSKATSIGHRTVFPFWNNTIYCPCNRIRR